MDRGKPSHPLATLRRFTDARIGLGRAGAGLPTDASLTFAQAHARARDAVHADFDEDAIAGTLAEAGYPSIRVASEAPDRATYLRRPDLGRRLADGARERLVVYQVGSVDLALVIGDGLSAHAVNSYGAAVAATILERLPKEWSTAPIILATGARVALGDVIGEALGARLVLMLLGERPGLSASDSLGAYVTYAPRTGRTDAERNCVSNIRNGGLTPARAAGKIAELLMRARTFGFSGVQLKDDEDLLGLEDPPSIA